MQAGDQVPHQWQPSVDEVLIGSADLSKRITALGHTLSADYRHKNLLLLVVLKGSFVFAADLSRALSIPHQLEFIRARSYLGASSTGSVQLQGLDPSLDLTGRHVLIIEDIIDTGLTLIHIHHHLRAAGAASVKTCTLLEKQTALRQAHVPDIDYIAFTIPDKFVVGFGLDYNQQYRHLPFIGVYNPSV